MLTIDQLDPRALASVQGVLTDIDDTLSTSGKLTAEAFDALWRLADARVGVVVVTGRPAGWCDHMARFWPVDAVVGENGGFYFHHDGRKLVRRFLYDEAARAGFRERLAAVRDQILREVRGTAAASDQAYREYDVAIDFCEDVAPLERGDVLRVAQMFEAAGAHAKISSIHVNGWYGDFDKLTTTRLCLEELFGVVGDAAKAGYVYCGDSPNDEAMFEYFPLSIGMANVADFLDVMTTGPTYVTRRRCGAGFCEVVERVLAARG